MGMNRTEELREKESRLHQLMDAGGLDGILLQKQANFSWLTGGGYNRVGLATETGATSLLVTRAGRYIIANRIEMRRMLVEEGLADLDFEPLEHEWYEERELELVRKIVPDPGKVGSDMDRAALRPLDSAVKRLRYCLTPPEIERYRFLGEKASAAVEKVMLGVRPGDSELEIAGRIGPELWRYGIDLPGVLVGADDRIYSYRHPIPTSKLLRQYLLVAVNARYKGLVLSLTRMLHLGRPTPAIARQFRNNLEIECRMIAATRPGAHLRFPLETALSAYAEFGSGQEWQLHHQGGGIGYTGRDFKVTPDIEGVVGNHQAFCWNPSITGTKTEDSFLATEYGPVMLSFPVVFPSVTVTVGENRFTRPDLLIDG
jgi:Xaa-Pro aminopeptidase